MRILSECHGAPVLLVAPEEYCCESCGAPCDVPTIKKTMQAEERVA